MSDVICLSSSDEESDPPKKKARPTVLVNLKGITITPIKKPAKNIKAKVTRKDNTIVLSDEDDTCVISKTVVEIDDPTDCQIIVEKPSENHENSQDECEIIEYENTVDKLKTNGLIKSLENDVAGKENIPNNVLNTQDNSQKEPEKLKGINHENIDKPPESAELPKSENSESDNLVEKTSKPSTSKSCSIEQKPPQTVLLEEFLSVCEEKLKNSEYEETILPRIKELWQFYKKCEPHLGESSNFKDLLTDSITKTQCSAARTVLCFKEVYTFVKDTYDVESVDVPDEVRMKLKKLEKTIKILTKEIKKLEEAEVNFDEEEDSAYLKYDRYTDRLNKVYSRYCHYLNKNPHNGRITHSKLDFVDSEYNEINRAINKKYKNNEKFPSYYEMENYIKKVVEEHQLRLTEGEIKTESTRCFEKLGKLLKHRRQRELYDFHYHFIKDNEDPATKDTSLSSVLNENYTQGQIKIEKVFQEYVHKQECGGEPPVETEDETDKSNYVDSEDEANGNEEEKKETNGNNTEEDVQKDTS